MATASSPRDVGDPSAPLGRLASHLEQQSDFSPAFAQLASGGGASLGGVWGSSRALVAAAIARRATGTILAVFPHSRDVDAFLADLRLFSEVERLAFPPWEALAGDRVVHDELFAERLRTLKRLRELAADANQDGHSERQKSPLVVATTIQSLMQPAPSRQELDDATRRIAVGVELPVEELLQWLAERRLHSTTAVELPGEFAVRGGIVDVYPVDADEPVRIEWFGDEIDSIRTFDPATQRSRAALNAVDLTALDPNALRRSHLAEHLRPRDWSLLFEPHDLVAEGQYYQRRQDDPDACFAANLALGRLSDFPTLTISGIPTGEFDTTVHLPFESVEQFSGDVARVRQELDDAAHDQQVILICDTTAEIERLSELFADTSLAADGRLACIEGRLAEGFRYLPQRTALLSAAQLFHREELARPASRRAGRAIDSFLELRQGDLVVHLSHGIGRYRGMQLIEKEGGAEEHLELEFHAGVRVYVPATKIELVQKYVGGRKAKPTLARIGGKTWQRQKQAAEKAVNDLAVDMLQLQAAREARPGIAFPADSLWQREFDAAFPYKETDDQLSAIDAIKGDMESPKPMDRLLCGDVGFGKTEVAMRAAFKAIDAGYQVAILAPTTVLAEQHRRTFTQRMAEFPFEIAGLSRFCTAKEQRQIVQHASEGKIDLLIGTHRMASPDVQFANLGLVII
ncbi:MAG: DEAD/DEAH box helicase, partial [Planctomycetales bacterium]|nr:DEAD/DEAH box helicase [Planctomycetales bacterium]